MWFHTRAVTLVAEDGISLSGMLHPGRDRSCDLGFVVGHGFTSHARKPAVRRVLRRFAQYAPTLGIDFRGHGRSGGRSSVGPDETADIAAGVAYLRQLRFRRVVTVGFSLGGSVVWRHTALSPPEQRPDAVVGVSSPARWWIRETAPMRRVHWLLEQPHGRVSARLLGVRLGPPWPEIPSSPIELAGRIAPTPALLVHGEHDHYFSVADALALHEASGAEFWLEPGMRHAESSCSPALVDRIAGWATAKVASTTHAPRHAEGTDGATSGSDQDG